jgi:PAS domain S-box-containing protein
VSPDPAERERAPTEAERLAELHAYHVLDTEPEAAFDGLVQAAAAIAEVPTVLVSLVDTDRQWFKARLGMDPAQLDRESAFCDHVVRSGAEMIVPDATADPRFVDNPLVTVQDGIRFYAGFPLQAPSGAVLGTLCVIDTQPRKLNEGQHDLLRTLADQVMTQLQLRRELLEKEEQLAERGRLLEQLAHSQARYRTLMENSFDIIISHRGDDAVSYLSPRLQETLGLSAAEASEPDALTRRAHPADRPALLEAARGAAEGRRSTVLSRVQHADGSWRQIEVSLLPILDPDGRVVEFLSTGRDVTEQNAAQIELKAASAEIAKRGRLLEEAQAVAQVGSWAYEVATQAITWSRELKRIFGMPPDFEPDFDTYRHMIHPEDRELLTGSLAAAMTQGGSYEVEHRLVRPDGEIRILLARGNVEVDAHGQPVIIQGTGQDVTEQRRVERERDEHATMLRAVIENNQSVLYVKDLQGRYLMVNRAWEQLMGIGEAQVLGRVLSDITDRFPLESWNENNLRALNGLYRVEEFIDGPTGRRYFDAVKVPLKDSTGRTYAICGLSLDITERRKAEQAQAQAVEAMATARDAAIAATKAKSAFLATMSHEIRTPMNAVIGMTGLLLDTALDPEQRDLLETVRSSGDQLLSIINDILDFSKIEAGDLELENRPFDLRETVETALAQFAGSCRDLDLIAHVSDDCPVTVVGDVVRLKQVIGNLVGNAVKFTQKGDVLAKVHLEPASGPDRVRLRFTVADTGIGISAEGMQRLFKSFSQVDASTTRVYGGTGLGLAISKAIVDAMGGELTVTSTPGLGSEFTFAVELGRFDGPQPELIPPAGLAALDGREALVVDDNATNRRILRLQLEGYGVTCTVVESPAEALALVGSGHRFDVAVLDYAMPIMDGAQLALALRRLPAGADLPLVLLSSVAARHRDQEDVFAAVLTKPTRSTQLLQTLADVVTGHPVPPRAEPQPGPAGPPAPGTTPGVPTPRAVASPPTAASGPPLRILLAEDNEVNQKVGRLMLAKIGHRVDIANNGQEALDAVRAAVYDVILMDMHMPVMDGLEATRRIRAEIGPDRQPRIVALTASVTTEDRAACAAAGMDGYLSKPLRAADLVTVLDDVAADIPATSSPIRQSSPIQQSSPVRQYDETMTPENNDAESTRQN